MKQLIAFDKSIMEDGWRLHAQLLKATMFAQAVSVSPSATASVSVKLHCWPHTKGRPCITDVQPGLQRAGHAMIWCKLCFCALR